MKTLKLGSKGNEVVTLQLKLGITADGDFGPKTEVAVKEFLKKNNLEIDGIVGKNTWKALGITETNKDFITYSPLSKHFSIANNKLNKYIVIHYTAGGSSESGSVLGVKHVFTVGDCSSDFTVDDTTILQMNPDLNKYYTWHCGDRKNPYTKGGSVNGKCLNSNSIGIEVCSNLKKGFSAKAVNHEGWYYTELTLNNVVKLVKYLMKEYNIPIERVVRHYDVTGKICPGIIGYNDEAIYDAKGNKTNKKSDSSKWLELKQRFIK